MTDSLVDFSSPKRFVSSLVENREAINEKVDAFTVASKKVLDKAINKTTEFIANNADRAGGFLIFVAGVGAGFSSIGLGINAVDPKVFGTLFKDFSTAQSAVAGAGLFIDAGILIPIGKNLIARRPAMDPKGFTE